MLEREQDVFRFVGHQIDGGFPRAEVHALGQENVAMVSPGASTEADAAKEVRDESAVDLRPLAVRDDLEVHWKAHTPATVAAAVKAATAKASDFTASARAFSANSYALTAS